jgi:hypothetical protein
LPPVAEGRRLAQIFFSLNTNLPPNVRNILARLDQRYGMPRAVVKPKSRGILIKRSDEETALKSSAFRTSPPAVSLDLKTRKLFKAKLTKTAAWLLRIAPIKK